LSSGASPQSSIDADCEESCVLLQKAPLAVPCAALKHSLTTDPISAVSTCETLPPLDAGSPRPITADAVEDEDRDEMRSFRQHMSHVMPCAAFERSPSEISSSTISGCISPRLVATPQQLLSGPSCEDHLVHDSSCEGLFAKANESSAAIAHVHLPEQDPPTESELPQIPNLMDSSLLLQFDDALSEIAARERAEARITSQLAELRQRIQDMGPKAQRIQMLNSYRWTSTTSPHRIEASDFAGDDAPQEDEPGPCWQDLAGSSSFFAGIFNTIWF